MGTRCLTFVHDESGMAIINMYRQFDGYPTGHGAELAEFLNSGSMVNGLRLGVDEKFFNGMGCLAAQMVAHFKKESGNFYLYSTEADDCGQDFEYHIMYDDGTLKIKVYNCGVNFFGFSQGDVHERIFDGNLAEFTEFCREKETA